MQRLAAAPERVLEALRRAGAGDPQCVMAAADAEYFLRVVGMAADEKRAVQVAATVLKAYRWQYIVSGAIHPHFQKVLASLVSPAQMARIQAALAPLTYAMPAQAEAAAAMSH